MDKWLDIPVNTDLLVTHMPPYGVRDMNAGGARYIVTGIEWCRATVVNVASCVCSFKYESGLYIQSYKGVAVVHWPGRWRVE